MADWLTKICTCPCTRTRTADDIFAGEDDQPSQNCLGKFCYPPLTHPITTGIAGVGVGAGATGVAIGTIASKIGSSAGVAAVIGIGTPAWIVMLIVGGISAGILTGSAMSGCCCSSSEASGDGIRNFIISSFSDSQSGGKTNSHIYSPRKNVTGTSSYEGVVLYTYESDSD